MMCPCTIHVHVNANLLPYYCQSAKDFLQNAIFSPILFFHPRKFPMVYMYMCVSHQLYSCVCVCARACVHACVRVWLPDGKWSVLGPGFFMNLLTNRILANVPLAMTASLPRRAPYELNSRGVNLQ